MPSKDKLGSTSYEIVQVARAPQKSVEKGKKITIERVTGQEKRETWRSSSAAARRETAWSGVRHSM